VDVGAAAAEQPPRRRGRPPKRHGSAGAACDDPSSGTASFADAVGGRDRPGAPPAPGMAECRAGECEERTRSAVALERDAAAPAGGECSAEDAAGEAAAAARLPDPDPSALLPDVAAKWWAKRWSAARSLHALQTLLTRLEVGGPIGRVNRPRPAVQGAGCWRQYMLSFVTRRRVVPPGCALPADRLRQAPRIRLRSQRSAGLLLSMRAPAAAECAGNAPLELS